MKIGKTIIQSKVFVLICASAWTVFLSILLLQPEAQPIIPTGVQPAPPSLERELLFSSVHIITMCFTAFLWCLALNIKTSRVPVFVLAVVLVAYGLSVEYLQGNIVGRTAQSWDMLANVIGIGLGFGLWHRLKRSDISKEMTITI